MDAAFLARNPSPSPDEERASRESIRDKAVAGRAGGAEHAAATPDGVAGAVTLELLVIPPPVVGSLVASTEDFPADATTLILLLLPSLFDARLRAAAVICEPLPLEMACSPKATAESMTPGSCSCDDADNSEGDATEEWGEDDVDLIPRGGGATVSHAVAAVFAAVAPDSGGSVVELPSSSAASALAKASRSSRACNAASGRGCSRDSQSSSLDWREVKVDAAGADFLVLICERQAKYVFKMGRPAGA